MHRYRDTSIENAIEDELRRRSIYYVKQAPLEQVLVADFFLPARRIVIEADGHRWHESTAARIKDWKKTYYLQKKGYTVYRFWESDIRKSAARCLDTIWELRPLLGLPVPSGRPFMPSEGIGESAIPNPPPELPLAVYVRLNRFGLPNARWERTRSTTRMLTLARRHMRKCPNTSVKQRSCSCPLWVWGTLHGQKIRKSLGIRNWEAGQKIVREWEGGGVASLPFDDAFKRFMADCNARNLGPETIKKYRRLEYEMVNIFGKRPIDAISLEDLSRYRESWNLAPRTSAKKIERMRTLFRFALDRAWCSKNPARLLRPPRITGNPTLPFSTEEAERIHKALELYPDAPKGRRDQVRGMVLLLENTGLRIADAVCLSKDKIKDGKLFLRTAKSGSPVWMPLPKVVLAALEPLPELPFWTGRGKLRSAVGDWWRTLNTLFKLAKVEDGHAHRFRDSFACTLLSRGVSLETVSILLGHADIRITQKHYAPWVRERQISLEAELNKVWAVGV